SVEAWLAFRHRSESTFLTHVSPGLADNYGDSINSDVRSAVFLTNNFSGFSFNIAALNDRSFLQVSPESSVVLRSAPEVRFSSVEQSPWKGLPFYFSFDS